MITDTRIQAALPSILPRFPLGTLPFGARQVCIASLCSPALALSSLLFCMRGWEEDENKEDVFKGKLNYVIPLQLLRVPRRA